MTPQEAIKRIEEFGLHHAIRDLPHSAYTVEAFKMAVEALSAQPEQRTGKWIKMSDADGVYYCCSECGEDLYREWLFNRDYDLFPRKKTIDKTKYCPHCGAKMEEWDG